MQIPSPGFQDSPGLEREAFWRGADHPENRPRSLDFGKVFNGVQGPYAKSNLHGKSRLHGKSKLHGKSRLHGKSQLRRARRQALFSNRKPESIAPEERVFIPFLGAGYYRYERAGRDIFFFSRRGEVLWRKRLPAYPVSDPRGKLLLLISGDGNAVHVRDINGNALGVGRLDGNMLTDYSFAVRGGAAALSFGGGRFFVLDGDGRVVLRYIEKKERSGSFFKSCALGPEGRIAALHLLKRDSRGREVDRILLLERGKSGDSGRKLGEVRLPRVYPHLLNMAVNRRGILVVGPRTAYVFALDGSLLRKFQLVRSPPGLYRPAYAGMDFFLYGDGDRALLLDGAGRPALSIPAARGGELWRVFPGEKNGRFVLYNPERGLNFFRYRSP